MYIETCWGKREGRRGGKRKRRKKNKERKFLTIVNISKKKYMPKNAYFIPSNICRSVVLPFPAALPPTPFDDDPAKIFSQAISQQGYHFNNRKYLLPDDIHIISFSFLFFITNIKKKEKKKKNSHARSKTETSPPFPFTAYYRC